MLYELSELCKYLMPCNDVIVDCSIRVNVSLLLASLEKLDNLLCM